MTDDERIEQAVRSVLDAAGVDYEPMPCDPEAADTAVFCARYGVALEDSANTIVVVGKTEPRVYVACVVLATTRLDVNGTVRARLGVRKASFASADETTAVTGMRIGGVTPFALPEDVPVWVDAAVLEREGVVFGGGSRALKIRAAPSALLAAVPRADVVEDLSRS